MFRYIFLVFAILCFAQWSFAKEPARFYVSFGYMGHHTHFEEKVTPKVTDTGNTYGFYGQAYYPFAQKEKNNQFLSFDFSYQSVDFTYDGAIFAIDSNGSELFIPTKGKTKGFMYNIRLKYGVEYLMQCCKTSIYALSGYRFYKRTLEGGYGYNEYYRWLYLGLGVGLNFNVSQKIKAGINAEGMYVPINSKSFKDVKVTLSKMDKQLEDNSFKLGSVYGYRFEMPIEYIATSSVSFEIKPFYEYWHVGKSETKPVNIETLYAVVPAHFTKNTGIYAGLKYTFR